MPTDKESGLWSTQASANTGEAELFGIALPVPTSVPKEVARSPVALCADMLRNAAGGLPAERSAIQSIPEERRACVVAKLYSLCPSRLLALMHAAKQAGTEYDAVKWRAVSAALASAHAFMLEKCSKSPTTDADDMAWTAVAAEFNRNVELWLGAGKRR